MRYLLAAVTFAFSGLRTIKANPLLQGRAVSSCSADNCERAIGGTSGPATKVPAAQRTADCQSYLHVVATPAPITITVTTTISPATSTVSTTTIYTVTSTSTSISTLTFPTSTMVYTITTSVTATTTSTTTIACQPGISDCLVPTAAKRAVTPQGISYSSGTIPAYASGSCGTGKTLASRYSSACSCIGVSPSTSTIAAQSTTVTTSFTAVTPLATAMITVQTLTGTTTTLTTSTPLTAVTTTVTSATTTTATSTVYCPTGVSYFISDNSVDIAGLDSDRGYNGLPVIFFNSPPAPSSFQLMLDAGNVCRLTTSDLAHQAFALDDGEGSLNLQSTYPLFVGDPSQTYSSYGTTYVNLYLTCTVSTSLMLSCQIDGHPSFSGLGGETLSDLSISNFLGGSVQLVPVPSN